MRLQTTECFRLQRLSRLIGATAVLLFFVLSSQAQTEAILPPVGGGGGSQFVARCPQGRLLTGFELRVGDDVDALRPICVAAYGPAEAGSLEPYPSKFGGDGGGADLKLLCPKDAPVVINMYIRAEGVNTVSVNNIHLFCGVAATTQRLSEYPSAVYDGPRAEKSGGFLGLGEKGVNTTSRTQRCPAGLVAVGVNGRSGIWLDALGLICGVPRLTPRPVVHPESTGIKPQGRVPGSTPSTLSKCQAAQQARARNSPAAPGLTAQCLAIVNDLAARGEAIANQDPLAAALRYKQTEGPGRRGFDIGIAAAEKDTLPGPAKQAIHDVLSPAERAGFDAAVSFSLERNRNAKLAAVGAAIARVDSDVAQGRIVEKDPFYSLGFDIATGIFGDPARGALGNTATGPGSLGIRDALSAAGRRGFNASVALHLSRNYTGMSGPSITVSDSVGTGPFTVYTRGMQQRTVNIGWNAGPDYTYCEIYLSVDNGEWREFARGHDGSKPADIKLGSSHTFRMMVYEGQAGTPKVIKISTVNGVL